MAGAAHGLADNLGGTSIGNPGLKKGAAAASSREDADEVGRKSCTHGRQLACAIASSPAHVSDSARQRSVAGHWR